EFGHLDKAIFPQPADFLASIDTFLAALPAGWRYGVEIRNPEYITEEYFGLLARQGDAHIFNAWTRMPTIEKQIDIPGAFTAKFSVVRALTQEGVSYEKSVNIYEPYAELKDPDPSTRAALGRIAAQALETSGAAYVIVNNRLEGHAPSTIDAVTTRL